MEAGCRSRCKPEISRRSTRPRPASASFCSSTRSCRATATSPAPPATTPTMPAPTGCRSGSARAGRGSARRASAGDGASRIRKRIPRNAPGALEPRRTRNHRDVSRRPGQPLRHLRKRFQHTGPGMAAGGAFGAAGGAGAVPDDLAVRDGGRPGREPGGRRGLRPDRQCLADPRQAGAGDPRVRRDVHRRLRRRGRPARHHHHPYRQCARGLRGARIPELRQPVRRLSERRRERA